jgi:type II secretory pathway pseudopilin PulG
MSPWRRVRAAFRGAGRRDAGQSGFTIPEMLIGALLATAAATLIATAIYQLSVASRDGRNRLVALGDVQNAALWIGSDTSEAQSFTAGSGATYGTLTTSDVTLEYRYSYSSSDKSLVREVLVSGSPTNTQRIARNIASQGDVTFSLSGTLLTVTITATSATLSESATLNASMRVR